MQAYYHALEPLRVKGKRLPVELFAVTPLYAEPPPLPPRSPGGGAAAGGGGSNGSQLQLAATGGPAPALDMPRMMSNHYSAGTEASVTIKPMIGE